MSTANFITKEELEEWDDPVYRRADDTYVPRVKETPVILPLLIFKLVSFLLFSGLVLVLMLWKSLTFNIDAVKFTRRNWG